MKLYTCAQCHTLLYFENTLCLNCGASAGFDSNKLSMVTLIPAAGETFTDISEPDKSWRYCENARYAACNWLVDPDENQSFCRACRLNRTIPSLNKEPNVERWRRIETAKHRLAYSLLRLHLPVDAKKGTAATGIAFDFLEDTDPSEKIMTGHANGTITLNIEEADEALRVRHKLDLGERYRTLLGHMRHEIGHYYWETFFLNDEKAIEKYRAVFGDERADYAAALKHYYENGAGTNWNNTHISPYATAHPWEDWAETWAHYLHLMDTLETAYSFGIAVNPRKASDEMEMQVAIRQDPYTISNFDEVIKGWLPLTFAVNSLNRSMGHPDFYPFIISATVLGKLKFIHEMIRSKTS